MGLFDNLAAQTLPMYEDDNEAIFKYISKEPAVTPAATKLKNDFISWYNGLGWLDKKQQATFQQATNRRNAFNVANSKSPEELVQVRKVIQTGTTKEELAGGKKKTDAAGNYTGAKGVTVASANPGQLLPGARATIRQGSKGQSVKEWQLIIGAYPDGIFGPNTLAATKKWQAEHGLKADGIVGPATWNAALNGEKMSFEDAAVTPVTPRGSKLKTGEVTYTSSIQVPGPSKTESASKAEAATGKEAKKIGTAIVTEELATGLTLGTVPTWAKITAGVSAGLLAVGGIAAVVIGVKDQRK